MADAWSDSFHSPLSGACDYYFECSCDQCEQDDRNVEAKGFCTDCQAHLCQECYDTHLRPKTMRHHVLLDENKMPKKEQKPSSKDICIEPCPTHPDKKLKYICPKHKDFGCGVCITLNHRDCKGVDYIPDVAGDVLSSKEYTEFQGKITNLTNKAHTQIQTSQDKVKLSKTVYADTHEAMKKFRKDILDAVDAIERRILPEADRVTAEDEKRMQSLEEKFKKVLLNVQALDARLTNLKNNGQFCQLFIALQRTPSEIAALESRLEEHSRDTDVQNYKLTLSEETQAFLQSPEKMVRLEKSSIDQTHQNINPGKVLRRDNDTKSNRSSQPVPPPPPSQYPCYTVRNIRAESSKHQDTHTLPAYSIFKPTAEPAPPVASSPKTKEVWPPPPPKPTEVHPHLPLPPAEVWPPPPLKPKEDCRPNLPPQPTEVPIEEYFRNLPPQPTELFLPPPPPQPQPTGHGHSTPPQQKEVVKRSTAPNASEKAAARAKKRLARKQAKQAMQASAAPKQNSTGVIKPHAEHVMDITVRGINDSYTPDITGSVLLPGGKLVIVDANHSKVKLIELAYVKITSELDLSLQWIWDITQINNSKVAVMSNEKKSIYVVNVGNKLSLENVVDVKDQCKGIDCIDNKFILTYDEPVKVEIVSITGQVLQIIVAKEKGGHIFTQPRHLAINNERKLFYVSDFASDKVVSVNLNGEVKGAYRDKNLNGPFKLTVNKTGSVYICGFDSNNIHCVAGDLSKGQIVLEKSDGVTRPQTISCCDVTGSLYIGMWRSDTLKVYQLKEL